MRQCLRVWANSSACAAAPRQPRPGTVLMRLPRPPRGAHSVRIAPTAHRRLCPASRVAAATGLRLARFARRASFFRRMREKGPLPGNICAKCMLFEIKMATSSPYASISGRNRAIQDAWRANLAIKCPFSRRGYENHAWREDVASAAHRASRAPVHPRSHLRTPAPRCPVARIPLRFPQFP